jgi:hypothetical protein
LDRKEKEPEKYIFMALKNSKSIMGSKAAFHGKTTSID